MRRESRLSDAGSGSRPSQARVLHETARQHALKPRCSRTSRRRPQWRERSSSSTALRSSARTSRRLRRAALGDRWLLSRWRPPAHRRRSIHIHRWNEPPCGYGRQGRGHRPDSPRCSSGGRGSTSTASATGGPAAAVPAQAGTGRSGAPAAGPPPERRGGRASPRRSRRDLRAAGASAPRTREGELLQRERSVSIYVQH
jgi:hypothetical protein